MWNTRRFSKCELFFFECFSFFYSTWMVKSRAEEFDVEHWTLDLPPTTNIYYECSSPPHNLHPILSDVIRGNFMQLLLCCFEPHSTFIALNWLQRFVARFGFCSSIVEQNKVFRLQTYWNQKQKKKEKKETKTKNVDEAFVFYFHEWIWWFFMVCFVAGIFFFFFMFSFQISFGLKK